MKTCRSPRHSNSGQCADTLRTKDFFTASKLFILALCLLVGPAAQATLSLYEGFDYGNGVLGSTATGSTVNWENAKSNTTVTNDSLSYSGLLAPTGQKVNMSGGAVGFDGARTTATAWTPISSGSMYFSFLLTVNGTNAVADGGGTVLVNISQEGQSSRQNISINLLNTNSGVNLGVVKYAGSTAPVSAAFFESGAGANLTVDATTTYLVVGKYEYVAGTANDVVTVWVNPGNLGTTDDPGNNVSTSGGADTTRSSGRFYISRGLDANIDELRIGTTWADVTPQSAGCVTANILTGPDNASVQANEPVSFSITAEGSSPTFQWQLSTDSGANWNNDFAGTGFDSPTYSFTAAAVSQNNYQYRCIEYVACDNSYKTSSVATLTVSCNAAGISSQPVSATVFAGDTTNFTVTATGSQPTYVWEVSTDGGANFFPDNGSYGTGFGSNVFTLLPTTVAQDQYKFRCIVSVNCDSSSITSAVVTLSVACSTANITSSPLDRAVPEGSTATFMVGTSGSNPGYQWQLSTDGGANWNDDFSTGYNTDTYTTAPTSPSDQGNQYRCIITVPCDSSSATSGVATLTVAVPGATAFRSVTNGRWQDNTTWEISVNDGSSWVPAGATPSAANCTNILIASGTTVSNLASRIVDQVVVGTGGTLVVSSTLTIAPATAVDLEVRGTLLVVGSSSALTIQSGVGMVVASGGVFAHDGTSGTCVNNSGTITVASGGTFQLRRPGGTVPIVTWNPGSTCEIAYSSASASRPNSAGMAQTFENFTWNNPLQSSGIDLSGSLTNINGHFLLANAGGQELKWSGDANFGGNLTINDGSLNVSGNSTPRVWTLKGDLTIGANGTFNVTASSSAQSLLILNGSSPQNYTAVGQNLANKLSWTVNSGATLNLNSDLPMSITGRTLTADGTVNLNGYTLITDLLAGTGTVRNQGGGNGLLVLGSGNGNNTIGTQPALLDGASGTLRLGQSAAGMLVINQPQTFSGGLVVSNGTVFVDNTSGSGTGSGPVTVVDGNLGGTGTIAGSVTIQSAGNLAVDTSIADLTINGVLTLDGRFTAEVNTAESPNTDRILGTSAVNYGGTLEIVNLGSPLTTSDTFQMFPTGIRSAAFTGFVPATPNNDAGLAWDTSTMTTDGTLRISTAAATPPTLNVSQSGSALTFSWSEAGFKLQSQTNSLTTGLGGNWFDYADLANPVNVPVDPAQGAVFFRLAPQ